MTNQIAKTIFSQLGGNKFAVITGAKNFIATSNALSFSIGRNKTKANRAVISLNEAQDLYTFELWAVSPKTGSVQVIEKTDGVYCDMLTDLFECKTGLYAKL